MANGIFGTNTDILYINAGGAGDYSGANGVFVDNVNRVISLTGDYASAIPQISANSANITELSSKFEDCCSSVQGDITNLSSSITNISGDVINKLDISSFSAVSGNFLTAMPQGVMYEDRLDYTDDSSALSGYNGIPFSVTDLSDYYKKTETSSKQEISEALASIQPRDPEVNQVVHTYSAEGKWLIASDLDPYLQKSESGVFQPSGNYLSANALEDYYKKTETSSKEEISAAIASIPQGNPGVNSFVQTNSSTIIDVDDVVQTNSGTWGSGLTGSYVPTSAIGYSMIIEDAGRIHPTSISGSSIWAPSAGNAVFALKANSAYRAQMDKNGDWIDSTYVKNSVFDNSASYWNQAISYISSVTTPTTDRTFLSGAIDYVSAGVDYISANGGKGGKTYTGVAPIVVNNDEVKISAETWDLSAGKGITFTDFDNMGITRLDVTGTFDNTAVNQVVQSYSAAGKWLTAHQSLDNYYQKTDTSSKQEISAALTALNNDLSAAIDYVSANGGKTYTGVAPIQVDNVNDEISVDCGVVSVGPGIDIVSDANGIKFSATNFYYSNKNPTTSTTSYSGLYIQKDYQQGRTTRTFYAGSEGVGELVPTGYTTGSYLTTTVAGMTWSPLPDYGAPVVLVATSGDIPASGSSDNKVYIVTGTV